MTMMAPRAGIRCLVNNAAWSKRLEQDRDASPMHFLLPLAALLLAATALPSLAQAEQSSFPEMPRRAAAKRAATPPTSAPPVSTASAHPAPSDTAHYAAPATNPAEQVADQAGEKPVVRDRNSGAYLQSVGRRVAARPLACPPRIASRAR
jgi:hypothetical protein